VCVSFAVCVVLGVPAADASPQGLPMAAGHVEAYFWILQSRLRHFSHFQSVFVVISQYRESDGLKVN
jgi:hypothetical protein